MRRKKKGMRSLRFVYFNNIMNRQQNKIIVKIWLALSKAFMSMPNFLEVIGHRIQQKILLLNLCLKFFQAKVLLLAINKSVFSIKLIVLLFLNHPMTRNTPRLHTVIYIGQTRVSILKHSSQILSVRRPYLRPNYQKISSIQDKFTLIIVASTIQNLISSTQVHQMLLTKFVI